MTPLLGTRLTAAVNSEVTGLRQALVPGLPPVEARHHRRRGMVASEDRAEGVCDAALPEVLADLNAGWEPSRSDLAIPAPQAMRRADAAEESWL